MKKLALLLVVCILSVNGVFAQSKKESKISVLLFGTFHFAQTGADDDMLSEKRQREITDLVNKLYKFKPDKIFIERNPEFEYTNKIGEKYQDYLDGKFQLSANEIYQLGFRLAKMLGHKKVYQADHPGRYVTIYAAAEDYANKNGQTEILRADAVGTTKAPYWVTDEPAIRKQKTVLEFIRYINSEEYQKIDQAHYVSTFPRVGDTKPPTSAEDKKDDAIYFAGAELLADWYKRNIKILSKVLTQLDYKEERILIIYGNGHIPILRHFFESNPAFKVENTSKWLK